MNGDPKNPDPRGPTPEAEVVQEIKVTTPEGPFEIGVIRINHERTPVAYAQLGETIVSIGRGTDGKVRVEIDDMAEEDVYISVNAMPLVKHPDETNGREMPWNMDREAAPTFTVIGFWRNDQRHVIGVVDGEHEVRGGTDPGEEGLFAEHVEAESWEAAEEQVHRSVQEGDEEEEYDFPFEELDARFTKLPNPSDPSEADHWEWEDAAKMPVNQVWTVVEGDSGRDWWATTGFHVVNKLFYVVTQEPWTDEDSAKNFKY